MGTQFDKLNREQAYRWLWLRNEFYDVKLDLDHARRARYYGRSGMEAEVRKLLRLARAIHAEMRVLDPSTDLWGGAGPDFRPGVAFAA